MEWFLRRAVTLVLAVLSVTEGLRLNILVDKEYSPGDYITVICRMHEFVPGKPVNVTLQKNGQVWQLNPQVIWPEQMKDVMDYHFNISAPSDEETLSLQCVGGRSNLTVKSTVQELKKKSGQRFEILVEDSEEKYCPGDYITVNCRMHEAVPGNPINVTLQKHGQVWQLNPQVIWLEQMQDVMDYHFNISAPSDEETLSLQCVGGRSNLTVKSTVQELKKRNGCPGDGMTLQKNNGSNVPLIVVLCIVIVFILILVFVSVYSYRKQKFCCTPRPETGETQKMNTTCPE